MVVVLLNIRSRFFSARLEADFGFAEAASKESDRISTEKGQGKLWPLLFLAAGRENCWKGVPYCDRTGIFLQQRLLLPPRSFLHGAQDQPKEESSFPRQPISLAGPILGLRLF